MMRKLRERVHEVLDGHKPEDRLGVYVSTFIIILILLNILVVILDSVQTLDVRYGRIFRVFELVSLIAFTIEFILRLWSCVEDPAYPGLIVGRIHYALTPLALVDLLAIAPFYLPMVLPFDLRFLRALRLFRLVRVLKIGRYSEALKTLGRVLRAKKEELAVTAVAVLLLLVISSSLMYFVEHEAQPKAFPDIPSSMWWGVVTLTTVGYGDVYPVTPLGKLMGSVIAFLGIGLFALPAGILASGFAEEVKEKKRARPTCPHCGKEL